MTETTTKENPSQSKAKDKDVKDDLASFAEKNDGAELDDNPLFAFGPKHIQTLEDAREAYLREEITLDQFNAARGRFGFLGAQDWKSPSNLERGDEAFHRDLPDDFFVKPGSGIMNIDDRLKLMENKQEIRDAATKASKEVLTDATITIPDDVVRNEAAHEAAEKVAKNQEDPSAEATVAPAV